MTTYNPDNWVVLKIKSGKFDKGIYKLLAGWSGGYLDGDAWRMNSGIEKIQEDGDYLLVYGYSGSVYRCYKEAYGLRMSNSGVYNSLIEQQTFEGQITMLPADTDWLKVDYI